MFGAVLSSIVIGFDPSESVHPFELVEFTNKGKVGLQILHAGDRTERRVGNQGNSDRPFRLGIPREVLIQHHLPASGRNIRKKPPLSMAEVLQFP